MEEARINLTGLEEAMTEQQNIIDQMDNGYNRSMLEGMKEALKYLGYDFVMRAGKYIIYK